MKVIELKALLAPLNDDMDIFIDDGREELFTGARIDNLTESIEDSTIIGYVLVGERREGDELTNDGSFPIIGEVVKDEK